MKHKILRLAPESGMSKMIDLIVNVVANNIPGFDAASELLKGYANIREQINQNRILDFALGLQVKGLDINNFNLSPECFSAIVTRLLLDDEKRKTEFYVKLTIKLAQSELDADQKIYYINTLSDLTGADIDFARELYIRKTIPLSGYMPGRDAELELTSMKQGIILKSLNKLISYGLLFEDRTGTMRSNPFYGMTNELNTLISYLFHPTELNPIVIGKQEKEKFDVIIIGNSADKPHHSYLINALKGRTLSVSTVEREDRSYQSLKISQIYIQYNALKGPNGGAYTTIFVLQTPDADITKLVLPNRKFQVDKEYFKPGEQVWTGSREGLLRMLDDVANYVASLLEQKE